jgi:erythromycin esterase-like protein
VRRRVRDYPGDPHADFNAEQNAYVLAEAEHYYRTMVHGGGDSWNVRDYHMIDTLDRLLQHHEQTWDGVPRGIVWQHNTHIGDARYTDMADAGMVNVGQLARERHEDEGVVLVGFASYQGSVIAGAEWGAPMARMRVPPGQPGSWESALHEAHDGDSLLLMDELRDAPSAEQWRGHRAIGVVYHPDYEYGNYVPTVLPRRYDALLYIDDSEALHPLHLQADRDKPPELYPWGL